MARYGSASSDTGGDGAGCPAYVSIMEVDRESSEPPYRQVARQLRTRIEAGDLTSRLPSAVTISQETGVAIFTARKALRVLIDDGVAEMIPGMGTYVRRAADTPPDLPG